MMKKNPIQGRMNRGAEQATHSQAQEQIGRPWARPQVTVLEEDVAVVTEMNMGGALDGGGFGSQSS